MCFFLYLASDRELKLEEWNSENPKVSISSKSEIFNGKTDRFTKKHIYYVSSLEGCGCGFKQQFDVEYPDYTEIDVKNENQKQLFEAVRETLKTENYVEFYGCWSGDEELDVEFSREIKLPDLLEADFYFREKELIKITK